jgi:hypothetical protein
MADKFEWMLPAQLSEVEEHKSKKVYNSAKDELKCLDVVIDAAEKARNKSFGLDSERRRTSFLELRRHAFGKTVVFKTEKQGVLIYRVSQANCEYASTELGYATPLSPMGRLCRLTYLGYAGSSKIFGDFEVIEIRNFTRFMGQQAEDNIRNFQLMQKNSYTADTGHDEDLFNIKNLRRSVDKWFSYKGKVATEPSLDFVSDTIEVTEVTEKPELDFDMDGFDNDYDEVEDVLEEVEQGDLIHSDYDQNDFYGISNQFYLNPTEKQMEVMSSHVSSGPMLVEGVAGSGKTCVAVGRAKTLCDSAGGGERLDGDNSEDFFAQESSVGFVRTGELVQYLRATCIELGLSHLPIQEYKVLQHDLRTQRDLEQRPSSTTDKEGNALVPKYKYLKTVNYNFQPETTMKWIQKVDVLVGKLLKEKLTNLLTNLSLSSNIQWDKNLSEESAQQILNALIEQLQTYLQPICNELTDTNGVARPFCIDGYVSKATKVISQLEKDWFNKDSLWINPTKEQWVKVKSNQEAITKLRQKNALFLQREQGGFSSILLKSIEDLTLSLSTVSQIVDKDGIEVNYNTDADLWELLKEGKLSCLLGRYDLEIKIAEDDDFMFSAAANTLVACIDNRMFPAIAKNPLFRSITRVNKENERTQSSLFKVFRSQINSGLLGSLRYADLYLSALKSDGNKSSMKEDKNVIKRLESKSLADHDIDVLLAIAQIISRGATDLKSNQFHLEEQENYFRTVFIDEVQDFTEVQVFLMGRQAHPKYNAITLVGDLYQQLYSGSASDPSVCFPYQGTIDKTLLIENKRQEHRPNLMALSSIFRAEIQGDTRLIPELDKYQTILKQETRFPDAIGLFDLPFKQVDEKIIEIIKAQPKGRTIAVVSPSTEYAEKLEKRLHGRLASEDFRESYLAKQVDLSKKYLVHFSSPEHIKGLEFDTLIMAGFEHADWTQADELNKIYVCISRPRKQLAVLADFRKIPDQFKALFS